MAELVGRMQDQFKKTSTDFILFSLRLISGLVLGVTFGLIMEVVTGRGEGESIVAFLFIMLVTTALFWRLTRGWTAVMVLVFDLVCVLLGMLLKLYIMVAPDA
jgi:hypothetical protein